MNKKNRSLVANYIARCPRGAQAKLKKVRAAIKSVAPNATERTDYFQIPGYSYPGYDYNGMFAWFSFSTPNVRLHVRPPVLQNHTKELVGYPTTNAIVSFPIDKTIPTALVKKLVQESIQVMKSKS